MMAAAAFIIASPAVYFIATPTIHMARGSGTAIIARMYTPAVVIIFRLPAVVVRDWCSLDVIVRLGRIRI